MKASVFSVILSFIAVNTFAQLHRDFKLPKTWTKDFTITLSFSGSMDGSNSHITFTFDSVKYVGKAGNEAPKQHRRVLTATDRAVILDNLKKLKIDAVKSESTPAVVNDGWSQSICFTTHCIDGGTSAVMTDEDKNTFLDAYNYLSTFASGK